MGCVVGLAVVLSLSRFGNRAGTREDARQGNGRNKPSKGLYAFEDDRKVFAAYAGSASCRECHEEEHELWRTSNHALAEREVEPAMDQRAFDPGRGFTHGSQSTTASWTNDTPAVTCIGLSGKQEMHPVVRVIGNTPLRQFLVTFPGGRLQTLEVAYDPRSNQWFNVYGSEDRKPGEWGHWTGRGMNWNYMCASCHNTRLRRNYDPADDSYHTTMAEPSVGCEACHGPLRSHNDWQRQFGKTDAKDPTVTKRGKAQVMDNCGSCHARRTQLTSEFKPGDDFLDDFELVTVDRTERYYADGQVRDEDYEYGSFLGSRMHQRGVTCTDCHNPHSMKTLLPGNWLCLRCHGGGDTNAPAINPVTHSRHRVHGFDTNGQPVNLDLTKYRPKEIPETGGECVNCHMPQTVYMQRHWRHDHGFTSPDPALTKQFGIPNACNRCHQNKDADWAMRFCAEWYGAKMERATRKRAQLIARSQRGETGARADLVSWLEKEDIPYWQAVAFGLLGQWSDRPETFEVLRQGLGNTNALVRTAAAGALEATVSDSPAAVEALRLRLEDPVRSVRIAAAAALRAILDPASHAGQDFERYLENNADEPSGQMQLGVFYFSRNDLPASLDHFRKAVEWDPYAVPMRQELAVVLSTLNRPDEAARELEQACRLAPRDAESHYKLGLAYNELGNLARATRELETVVQLDPRHSDGWYNLGLAQNTLGETEAALESLLQAEVIDPRQAKIPYARATILAHLARNKEAANEAEKALALNPGFSEARALLEALRN